MYQIYHNNYYTHFHVQRLKKSQCTPLFMLPYRQRGAGAVIHTHSPNAVMATLLWPGKEFRCTYLEMIKVKRKENTMIGILTFFFCVQFFSGHIWPQTRTLLEVWWAAGCTNNWKYPIRKRFGESYEWNNEGISGINCNSCAPSWHIRLGWNMAKSQNTVSVIRCGWYAQSPKIYDWKLLSRNFTTSQDSN